MIFNFDFFMFDQVVRLFGGIVTVAGGLAITIKPIRQKIIEKLTCDNVSRNALCALLRNQILSECRKAKRQHGMYMFERDNLHNMFDQYVFLGGNHGVKDLVDEVFKLPTLIFDEEQEDKSNE